MSIAVLISIISVLFSVLGILVAYIFKSLTTSIKELNHAVNSLRDTLTLKNEKIILLEQVTSQSRSTISDLSVKVNEHERLIDRLKTAHNACPTSIIKI